MELTKQPEKYEVILHEKLKKKDKVMNLQFSYCC